MELTPDIKKILDRYYFERGKIRKSFNNIYYGRCGKKEKKLDEKVIRMLKTQIEKDGNT